MSSDLPDRFKHHKVDDDGARAMEMVRSACLQVAKMIEANVPDGRERSLAIARIEEAVFWANAGIARSGEYTAKPDERTTTFTKYNNDYSAGSRICAVCGEEYGYGSKHEH